ncbi:MAG: hypothetical protein FJX54_22220 [Alphaproteobacteria bacterium]|nr:hypothetical protein [Alphaproteobacteria bacterium]
MTTLYALAGLVLIVVASVWLAIREGRKTGRAEAREEEARHVVENAERITAARDAAPADADALARRVLDDGKPL